MITKQFCKGIITVSWAVSTNQSINLYFSGLGRSSEYRQVLRHVREWRICGRTTTPRNPRRAVHLQSSIESNRSQQVESNMRLSEGRFVLHLRTCPGEFDLRPIWFGEFRTHFEYFSHNWRTMWTSPQFFYGKLHRDSWRRIPTETCKCNLHICMDSS